MLCFYVMSGDDDDRVLAGPHETPQEATLWGRAHLAETDPWWVMTWNPRRGTPPAVSPKPVPNLNDPRR